MSTLDVNTTRNSRNTAWRQLLIAGGLEIVFATALKIASDGQVGEKSTHPAYIVVLVAAIFSFDFLSRALKEIPLGTAYAVWTGIGSVGALLVGVVWFGEGLSVVRVLLVLVLIGALLGLKLTSDGKTPHP